MAKIVEDGVIMAVLQDGLSQVNENLFIDEFESAFDTQKRKLRVSFTAVNNKTSETVAIKDIWGWL